MTPCYDNGLTRLYQADARQLPVEDKSCHMICTSPPYWQQRRYKDADARTLGNEATPAEYVANLVTVFRECYRVLREDGICWVNLGEKRADTPGNGRGGGELLEGGIPHYSAGSYLGKLHPLNRVGIPERFALAMQADGWVWRDSIVWAKQAAMPESVAGTRWERCRVKVGASPNQGNKGEGGEKIGWSPANDGYSDTALWSPCPGCKKCAANDGWVLRRGSWRCTNSYEMIYMFVKGEGYWSDGEAVKTAHTREWWTENVGMPYMTPADGRNDEGVRQGNGHSSGANRRNVWQDITPENLGSKYGHYAAFPSDLPERCILASTSERGCCPSCGAGWARCVEPSPETAEMRSRAGNNWYPSAKGDSYNKDKPRVRSVAITLGFRPTCDCGHSDTVPALVLDPFCGTATTCVAAQRLGRRSIGVDLSPSYLKAAAKRLGNETLPLVAAGRSGE